MSKEEFLETLRRSLARELSETDVADHINYYWNYIEQQIAQGHTEAEVLAQLGDPRLIAKTILQVDQQKEEAADGQEEYYRESYTEQDDGTQESYGRYDVHTHKMTVSDWIKVALVVIVIFMVLGTVFRILWKLLPVLLVGLAVMWIYRKFTER